MFPKKHVFIWPYSPSSPQKLLLKLVTKTGLRNFGKIPYEYGFYSPKPYNLSKTLERLLSIGLWWKKPSLSFREFLLVWQKLVYEVKDQNSHFNKTILCCYNWYLILSLCILQKYLENVNGIILYMSTIMKISILGYSSQIKL